MDGATIITQFELQVDDVTQLSSDEELVILNRVYRAVLNDRPWEFLKKESSGSILSDANGSYITLPSDFEYIAQNASYTANNINDIVGTSSPMVIFIGTSYQPYVIINFSDRRQYRNKTGFAYVDLVNDQIRFTGTPDSSTYEFDYIYKPADLLIGTSPVFTRNNDILVYGMAVDNDILQKSPKAKSYLEENNSKYNRELESLALYNSQFIMN